MRIIVLAFLAVLVGVALAACSKTVSVDLTLVEPCDQKNQALNGIASFVVSTSGAKPTDDTVAFSVDQGPQPVDIGLGDVIVTVKAFTQDVSGAGAASTVPQSVGRTSPLPITAASQDQKAMVLVGKVDSFGKTTGLDGSCTAMTATAPVHGRHGHTATFVPVLNQVLIYGGAVWVDGTESLLASAELYDPATGTYTPLEGVDTARAYHAATALPDGRVLITGGFGVVNGVVTTQETAVLFDPAVINDPFTALQMKHARAHHTSTLIESAGLVAIVGGCFGEGDADGCTPTQAGSGAAGASTALPVTIETFDVARGTVATVAVPAAQGLATPRAFHDATVLDNTGNALLIITGGVDSNGTVCSVEAFGVDGGVLTRRSVGDLAPFPANKCPARHAAVAIDNQRIVIIGGQTQAPGGAPSGPGSGDAFIFLTSSGVEQTPSLHLFGGGGRFGHLATKLADDTVLVVGGTTSPAAPTAEVLPLVGEARVLAGPPGTARDHAAMAILPGTSPAIPGLGASEVLVSGGYTTAPPFETSDDVEVYFGP